MRPVSIFPANFNAVKSINDPCTHSDDANGAGKVQTSGIANVKFKECGKLRRPSALYSYDALSAVATASNNLGDELLVDYNDKYRFN